MKKLTVILLTLVLVLSCVACGGGKDDAETGYEIALVTDVGNIDDRSFNQAAYEGMKEYAEKNNKTYSYYRPTEDSTASRIESITSAVENGAKVVICPGYLFEDAVYTTQDQFPEVAFILIDGTPHDSSYADYKTAANTYAITYQEEQSGFFAGYSAVMDGYRELGFLGGMAVPAVVRYGIGYVQGAAQAAQELGLADGEVNIKYWYSGVFSANDEIKNKMSAWYTEGTEIVFSCGGGILDSCIAAAEEGNGKIIGVDVDQSSVSDRIVTSAYKNLAESVILALTSFYNNGGAWDADHAGVDVVLGAAEGTTGIPTDANSWRFTQYTVEQYEAIFQKVLSGEVAVASDTTISPVDYGKYGDVVVTVDVQE